MSSDCKQALQKNNMRWMIGTFIVMLILISIGSIGIIRYFSIQATVTSLETQQLNYPFLTDPNSASKNLLGEKDANRYLFVLSRRFQKLSYRLPKSQVDVNYTIHDRPAVVVLPFGTVITAISISGKSYYGAIPRSQVKNAYCTLSQKLLQYGHTLDNSNMLITDISCP